MSENKLDSKSVGWLHKQIFESRNGGYPQYQRKDKIWSSEDNKLFIDSILRGYDIPKLYFRNMENNKFEVLDGQQRLKACFSYKLNMFKLGASMEDVDDISIVNCRYCDLEEALQNKFNTALLDICWLQNYTDVEASSFFRRLQRGTPLVPAEKRHAMIESNMRDVVTKLTNENKVFRVCDFTNKKFEDEDAIAKILYLHLKGRPISLGHKQMEGAYKEYKDLANDNLAVNELNKALNFIRVGFNSMSKKLNRNGLITASYLYTLLSRDYCINHSNADKFAESYIKIDDDRVSNKNKPVDERDQEFMAYDLNMRYNSKKDLEGRFKFLKKRIINLMGLKLRDKKRFLTKEEKDLVRRRDVNVCQICGKQCTEGDWAIDHIVAHSNGGSTSINNSQLVCGYCNSKKGNN